VGTGEAVTSFLEDKGIPGIVERTMIRPPASQLGPIDPAARSAIIAASPMAAKYSQTVDRDSAYEKLRARSAAAAQPTPSPQPDDGFSHARRYDGGVSGGAATAPSRPSAGSSRTDSLGEAFAKSFARQLGTRTGQAVVRGILGSIFGKR
jgi:DNA helicase HerA-like ATPase